uniref:GTD-binding domain-containing protein n=1 Tax=Oryza barthii TaxID=65489 RepID=A0A0D3HUH9_9ORYZ
MVRELIAVVARAALQWALSSLLLANGAAFCLIAAAASWLRLGPPPCLLCAGVHRLLCSAPAAADADDARGQERAAFRRLLCDAHVAAMAASEPEKKKQQQQPDQQKMISASDGEEKRDAAEVEISDKPGGMEGHRVVSIGSEICEQDHAGGDQRSTAGEEGYGDGPYDEDGHGHAHEVFDDLPAELRRDGDGALTVGRLAAALRAQRRELEAVRAELDGERRACAEAAEYQRQLEEQGEFDREAVRLAMQLVHEAETEKHALQRQLDAFRVKAHLYDYEAAATAAAATDHDAAGDGGGGNNYQSLVDFLPGSVFSSSPDLANLLKLYTEGNGGGRRLTDAPVPVVTEVVEEEEEEEEEEEVAVAAIGGVDSNGNGGAAATIAIAGDSLQEGSSDHLEPTNGEL